MSFFGEENSENSLGVSAVAGLLFGSCCMLRRVERVMRTGPGDFGWSRRARGDVEVDGVLEGVGVLSDSSESLTSWDLPTVKKELYIICFCEQNFYIQDKLKCHF